MKVSEILKKDTRNKSLGELIEMLGSVDDAESVYKLRKRHEEDTGIPMENDDFGKGEGEMAKSLFPDIVKKLED